EAGAQEQRWLVHEALLDARKDAPGLAPEVTEALAGYGEDGEPRPAGLRSVLSQALEADWRGDERALLTRVVCARAAQLEIVRQELPVAVAASRGARELGSFTKPLSFAVEDVARPAIEELRDRDLPKL